MSLCSVKSLIPYLGGMYKMSDKNLTCKDCGKEFVFTEGEQAFYQEKGFENEPQRCPDCRRARKQTRRNNDNRGFAR
jgi:hypothetical protein